MRTLICLVAVTGITAALACGGGDLMLPSASRPAAMAVVKGNNQTAPGGQALADSVVVRVTDPQDRPVAQLRVAFVVTAGGGTAAPDTAVTDNDGRTASRWTLGPSAGPQTVVARVAGSDAVNATFTATASAVPALSTTQITAVSPEPSFPTQPVTIAVTVTSIVGAPTGTVTVTDGTVSCTASAPTGECSLTPTVAGATTLTATYAGSATFAASSGTAQHQVILAGTSTTLSSSLNPSAQGQPVTFTASVTSPFRTPTGSVQFVEGSCTTPTRTWSTTTLDSTGQGSFSTDNLSRGTHTMLACYLGNGTFSPSASNGLQQRVTRDEQR
ncbi:MAG: Ig-like domain repeat protein [Gemmatimonadota bacterium]